MSRCMQKRLAREKEPIRRPFPFDRVDVGDQTTEVHRLWEWRARLRYGR